MGVKVTFSDGLNWRTVDNKVKNKIIDGSLLETLKPTKKIKRRTEALNIKLNKRTARKSYSWYVKTKTSILRNITDNEDTDNEIKDYSIGIDLSGDTSSCALPCSSQSTNISINSLDADSADDVASPNLSEKQITKKRKKSTVESRSSVPLTKRKCQRDTKAPKPAPHRHDKTQEKGLKYGRRNLTSSLENFIDDNSTIDESSKIDKQDCHEFLGNRELTDCVQFENLPSTKTACKNTDSVSDKISENSDTENNDTLLTQSIVGSSNKEKKEESKDISNGPFDSDSPNNSDYGKLQRARKSQKRKSESHSSEQLTINNLQDNENVLRADSVDHNGTPDKCLTNVKRNLTSLLEDCKDDNGITGESIEIDKRDSNKFRRITELQDSVPSDNLPNETISKSTEFASDKKSVNIDVESNNKPIMRSPRGRPKSEKEDRDEEEEDQQEENEEKKEEEEEEEDQQEENEKKEEGEEDTKARGGEEKEEEEEEKKEKASGEDEEKEEDNDDDEEESLTALAVKEENQQRTILKESPMKKSQPVIMSTEIVKSKYTIVRDEEETTDPDDSSHFKCPVLETSRPSRWNKFLNDQEASQLKKLISANENDAQRRKINLVISNSSDSEDNRIGANNRVDVDLLDSKCIDKSVASPRASSSQIISDSLNFDESISQSNDTDHHTVTSKSIISQIRKQESSLKKITETSTRKAEINMSSLKKTSVNLLEKVHEDGCGIDNSTSLQNEEEGNEQDLGNDLRPSELCEFVDREGLVATEKLSTLTAKDFKEFARENNDEDIWLMEIPKSVITSSDELCGKIMAFENGKMCINGTTYRTKCKDGKSITCILRSRRKKSRFKTVNVEPVGCIVVRQEFSDETTLLPPAQSASEVPGGVPFPVNLKSRNPLLGFNPPDDVEYVKRGSTAKQIPEIAQTKKKSKKEAKIRNLKNFALQENEEAI